MFRVIPRSVQTRIVLMFAGNVFICVFVRSLVVISTDHNIDIQDASLLRFMQSVGENVKTV